MLHRLAAFILISLLFCCRLAAKEDILALQAGLQHEQNDSLRLGIYYQLYNYYSYSQPDSAYYFLNAGLKEFTAKDYKNGIAYILFYTGTLDNTHGNLALAKKRQTEALNIFKEVNDLDGIAKTENALGIMEAKDGKYDIATGLFIDALQHFENAGNENGVVNTYINLGRVNSDLNNHEKALDYFIKGIAHLKDTVAEVGKLCRLYNNIGIEYGKMGNLEKAMFYLNLELHKSDKEKMVDVYIYSLMNIGNVEQRYKKNLEALAHYNEALQLAVEKHLPDEQAQLLHDIGGVLIEIDPKAALKKLDEAATLAKTVGNAQLLDDVYSSMIAANKKLDHYEDAVKLLEVQKAMDDSMFAIDKVKQIANLESVHELEKTNNNLKQLQLQDQKDLLKRNILIVIALSLVLLLGFISFYFRRTRKLNQLLTQQKDALAKANSTKDMIFSIIGHDLRGPVGNLTMVLDTLEDPETPEEDKKYIIHALKEQTETTADTLDKLLYWGKSQIKGSGIKSEDFSIGEYINNGIALLKANAQQKTITIIDNAQKGLKVHGDSSHYDFIVRNLLSNAVKFTPENGTITIFTATGMLPGYTVTAVTDTGIGMNQATLADLFKVVNNSTRGTANEKGTGIGLMICYEFAKLNGGNIWAVSEPGKGSTFFFSFKTAE